MKGPAWSWCPSTACRPSCSCSWRRASTATACDTPTPTAASTISNTRGCGARRTSCAAPSSSEPRRTLGGQPGSPQLGGPIVAAGGLVFIGATLDKGFRAFDVETGRELWKTDLPASARATPMTYDAGGRQFVVIAAGGSDVWGAGDAIIAFALPR